MTSLHCNGLPGAVRDQVIEQVVLVPPRLLRALRHEGLDRHDRPPDGHRDAAASTKRKASEAMEVDWEAGPALRGESAEQAAAGDKNYLFDDLIAEAARIRCNGGWS